MRTLIIIDMQNDFISGSLKNPAAEAIVEPLCKFIEDFSGNIICTRDDHDSDYLKSAEGKKLPIEHCIRETAGWCIDDRILKALRQKRYDVVNKYSFGTLNWKSILGIDRDVGTNKHEILLCGTCTDICVISNALILKACYPEADIKVLSDLCAGLTPELHEAALKVMQSCQVDIVTTADLLNKD